MLKDSGIVIMVRNAGTATSGSCQAISPMTDAIMLPTTINAGAVAAAGIAPATGATNNATINIAPVTMAVTPVAAGIAPATGATNNATINIAPVTMAVTPVRPPAATPAALSM